MPTPSDYLLAHSDNRCYVIGDYNDFNNYKCNEKNYLLSTDYSFWTASGQLGTSGYLLVVRANGRVSNLTSYGAGWNGGIKFGIYRPVIYLSTNVKITSGNGSSTSPYQLSL